MRLANASAPIATIQIRGYHDGQRPGGSHSGWAASAASAARAGASTAGSRERPRIATRPASPAASSNAVAARKSDTSHATHSVAGIPRDGGAMPRDRSRRRKGATASRTTAATGAAARPHRLARTRRRPSTASTAIAAVIARAPTLAVKGAPRAA